VICRKKLFVWDKNIFELKFIFQVKKMVLAIMYLHAGEVLLPFLLYKRKL